MTVLNIILLLVLQSDASAYGIIYALMIRAGMWAIFRKCGVEGWWALVPCVSEYRLGQCADRRPEGRVLFFTSALNILVQIGLQFLDTTTSLGMLYGLFGLLISLVQVIYSIRVYLGLIENFNRGRAWIIPWLLVESLTSLLWGFHPKFKPMRKVEEIRSEAAEFFSGKRADVLDQGLTVNLEKRTAREFLHTNTLLRDIHMYIKPGRMVLLLGGSGAGKTTFLNAVNGYEKAKAEVMLNGQNLYKDYKRLQYDIGFVPQQDLMRGSDSVFRTLMDAASLRLPKDMGKADRKARVEQVMEIFGLLPVKDSLVSKLSGGQRKRLSIAMEFVSNPTLFILDEPDSGLDGVMARELFQQLRMIADQGKIIIVITHTPDRVIDLFDDVIVLAKDAKRTGRLAFFGPVAEAREFFGKERMEEIVKSVNREEEGGEGRADEFILKYAEVQHG